jgi:hypothetical protein
MAQVRIWRSAFELLVAIDPLCLLGLARYVGVDIAKTSLVDFVDRLQSLPAASQSKIISLIELDMGDLNCSLTKSSLNTYTVQTRRWSRIIPFPVLVDGRKLEFDIASCQFAVHYMFQTREKAKYFLCQINQQLAQHGVFVVTTVDSRVISSLVLKEVTDGVRAESKNGVKSLKIYSDLSTPASVTSDSDPGKDLVLELTFQQAMWDRMIQRSRTESDAFGIEYQFRLYDQPPSSDALSQQQAAVNAPEWLVPLGRELQDLTDECGLEIILCENFHQFIDQKMKTSAQLRLVVLLTISHHTI